MRQFNVSSEPDVHVFGLWEEAGGTPEKKARGRLFVADTRWLQIIPKISWKSRCMWDTPCSENILSTRCYSHQFYTKTSHTSTIKPANSGYEFNSHLAPRLKTPSSDRRTFKATQREHFNAHCLVYWAPAERLQNTMSSGPQRCNKCLWPCTNKEEFLNIQYIHQLHVKNWEKQKIEHRNRLQRHSGRSHSW